SRRSRCARNVHLSRVFSPRTPFIARPVPPAGGPQFRPLGPAPVRPCAGATSPPLVDRPPCPDRPPPRTRPAPGGPPAALRPGGCGNSRHPVALTLLGISLLALAIGPVLFAMADRARATLAALDGFVMVAVAGLAVVHIIPHAVATAGVGA